MKNIIKNKLEEYGYSIIKNKNKNLIFSNYIETLYSLRKKFPISNFIDAFEIDINYCVSHNGLSFSETGWHPFVATLKDFGDKKHMAYKKSILEKYYNSFKPKTSFEPCISPNYLSNEYLKLPHYSYIFPWDLVDANIKTKGFEKDHLNENATAGKRISISAGSSHHGPVDIIKGEIEFKRLIKLFNSIITKGYSRKSGRDGDIMGTLLFKEGKYRFIVEIGFHRVAVLKALDYKKIPVRLLTPIVVEKEHVLMWNKVKSGLWSKLSAEKYFDSLFTFNSKEWANNFIYHNENINN